MKNVIIPYSLASLQERDHIIYDKVAEKPMILKRGTYKASDYDTARYSLPHSQFMEIWDGKPISAPLDFNGSTMWAQSSFYKITGLTYPATLNIEFYHTGNKTTTTVTGNDAASLATAIKAIHSYVIKTEVLSDGIGVQCNSYNTTDMTNAIYGGMRFRIMGDDAEKIDDTHVSIGNITLQMMDKVVYQCQLTKDVLKAKGIALMSNYIFPWLEGGSSAYGPIFHLQRAVEYLTANGVDSFSTSFSSKMKKSVFDALGESSNATERAFWLKYHGSYEEYIARWFMKTSDVRGVNTLFADVAALSKILGTLKTLDYKGTEVDAYPCMAKCLAYGFDDAVHAPGKWVGADWRLASLLMRRVGYNASNKTAWDREILLVGGSPTYATRASFWLPCCERSAYYGMIYYATGGAWDSYTKYYSYSVAPFLASDF